MRNVNISKYYKFVGYPTWKDQLDTIVYVTGETNIQESESFEAQLYDSWFSAIPNGAAIFEEMKRRKSRVFICQTVNGYEPLNEDSETETIYVPMGIIDYLSSDDIMFVSRHIIKSTTTPFLEGDEHHPENVVLKDIIEENFYRLFGRGTKYNVIIKEEIIPSREYIAVKNKRDSEILYITEKDSVDKIESDRVIGDARKVRYEWERAKEDLDRKRVIIGQQSLSNNTLYGVLKSRESDIETRELKQRLIHNELLAIDNNIPSWEELLQNVEDIIAAGGDTE